MESKRVLLTGVFDLLSTKYMSVLEYLHSQHYTVVIGVYSDEDCSSLNLPIVMTHYERVETLKHSKYVDEIISPCPYTLTASFLQSQHIEIVFVEKLEARHSEIESFTQILPHFEGTDADSIISRVLDQFDEYCERNLSRGYSCEDMGLSSLEGTALVMRLARRKLETK